MKQRTLFYLLILVIMVGFVLHDVVINRHARSNDCDVSTYFTEQQLKQTAEAIPWMKNAKAHKIGNLIVLSPEDTNRASLYIVPASPPYFPMILLEDNIHTNLSRGKPQKICLIDGHGKRVEVDGKVKDGVFDSYVVTTSNGVSYYDKGFDGSFKGRFWPSGKKEIMCSNVWHSYHMDGNNMVIER